MAYYRGNTKEREELNADRKTARIQIENLERSTRLQVKKIREMRRISETVSGMEPTIAAEERELISIRAKASVVRTRLEIICEKLAYLV